MTGELFVPPHSYFRTNVGDLILRETSTRRLIFRAELVDNQNDPAASVHGRLMYQRKHSGTGEWQDEPAFDVRTMKNGESVCLILDAEATRTLFLELQNMYQLPIEWGSSVGREWVMVNPEETYVARGREREAIEKLIAQDEDGFVTYVEQILPDLVNTIVLKRQHEERCSILAEFEEHLGENDWNEPRWQKFFRENMWIFGQNLVFQFLSPIQDEAYLGGTTFSGRGAQKVDFLFHSEATARFTVVVDIKRPDTDLVGLETYRNTVYPLGSDLTGGVSQVQSYCRRWVKEGSEQEANAEFLRNHGIYTYEPRGILVIGHCRSLDNPGKRATFELYRRNLHNPEVVTFDELYARAHFSVHGKPPAEFDPAVPRRYQD